MRILIALHVCGVQHVTQLAQPHGVVQQAFQHCHGDGAAEEAEGGELGATAQRGWQGLKLVVHDASLVWVQVLQGGQCPLNQDLQGLQTEASQVDPTETQVLQQADAQLLQQVRQV